MPSSRGSPTLIFSAASFAAASASAWRARGTSIRVGASQDWPVFDMTAVTPAATASAILALGRMMLGDLPPSSCATRFTVGAAAAAIAVPARVEPVKLTISTSGCSDIRAPTSGPAPWTRLNTPAGTPASWQTCAKSVPDSGAISDGFKTMVQPAISAGATLQAIWFIGQFQGVINEQTPIPSCTIRVVPRLYSQANSSPALIVASKWTCPAQAWALRAQVIGAPISVDMTWAKSSKRSL